VYGYFLELPNEEKKKWKFRRRVFTIPSGIEIRGDGVKMKISVMGEVWIFCGTTQSINLLL